MKEDIRKMAIRAYHKVKNVKNKKLIIIDFRLPKDEQRLWVFDMTKNRIIHHTYVAHGVNSGLRYPKKFSNVRGSLKSSLGVALTAETYYGKHGLSLKLDGLEEGFNSNMRQRYVVIHGAKYVRENGRVGRSWGCPAVSMERYEEIINDIKGGAVLFSYYPDEKYLRESKYIN